MEKINRGMEHFWLAVTIASAIYAFYKCFSGGWAVEYMNFIIPIIAFFWFLTRRFMRQRMERSRNNPDS
ncbi:MAG: hypothetical protein SH856_01695 [Flavobacteriales bacterium]|nr:hypothetical protein [Flavobacteriales bacterium]